MGKRQRTEKVVSFSYSSFENTEELIHNLIVSIKQITTEYEFNSFYVGVSWPRDSNIVLLKKTIQCRIINEISIKYNKEIDFATGEAYFLIDFSKKLIFFSVKPIYLYGKYNKFSREIAQTTHYCRKCQGKGCSKCKTGTITKTSVEQLLAQIIVPYFNSQQLVFHGGGREDVDVLMLGEGREFVVELTMPKKRTVDLDKLENKLNSLFEEIKINSLNFVIKEKIIKVKNTLHEKIYKAIVYSPKYDLSKLNLNKKFVIKQKTPTRVSKRRADLTRKKEITLLKTKPINENEFELQLKTSHGTYVKEFISGDNKLTNPSLSSLLKNDCECKELDVIEIL